MASLTCCISIVVSQEWHRDCDFLNIRSTKQSNTHTSWRIIQFPCISWIGIGESYVLWSLTFGLHLLSTPMVRYNCNEMVKYYRDDTGYFWNSDSQPSYIYTAYLCGLCHHPPLSNSGNVSGHHLTGSNKTRCWSSFVSFVAIFSSVQCCHPCHLSLYFCWLCPLICTWN